MKKLFLCFLCLGLCSMFCITANAGNNSKKIAYVTKTMKLDKATSEKLTVVLNAYYDEEDKIKAPRKALKNKLENLEATGKLSASQCDELFTNKLTQEKEILDLRKKYYEKFKTVLSTQQAYQAIKLCNDKLNK